MNRPQTRKSKLSQTHPAAPAPPAAAEPAMDAPPRAARPKSKGPTATSRTKMTFYTTDGLVGQVRAFLANVPTAQHGYRNVSEFVDAAVSAQVDAMQEKYNQGKAWPPAEAGSVARGRPVE